MLSRVWLTVIPNLQSLGSESENLSHARSFSQLSPGGVPLLNIPEASPEALAELLALELPMTLEPRAWLSCS